MDSEKFSGEGAKNEAAASEIKRDEYAELVAERSPKTHMLRNILWAFVVGGLICVLGQMISDFYKNIFHLNKETVDSLTPMTLVFLSALFTGLNVYDKLARRAGGGTLVPITGFANAIVSPAMEFKKEGLVLGLASKMFVIAGPVLVYGVSASIVVGLVYLMFGL
jgi:stage V sporulation protein AC